MKATNEFPSGFPLGRRFGLLMRLYFGALTKKLEQLDIDRHYSVLILLENAEAPHCQQSISDLLKMDKASMVRVVDYLVKKGYVKRLINPDDRREHRLGLTDKAKKTMPRIHKAIEGLNSKVTSGLSPKQIKEFYGMLDLLDANLANEPKDAIVVNVKKLKSARK